MYEPPAILDRPSIETRKAPRKEGVLLRVTGTMPPRLEAQDVSETDGCP